MSGRGVAAAGKCSSSFPWTLLHVPQILQSKAAELLKSAALCFTAATYFLIIPYFRRRSLMFCRRRFSQVCTSLPVTQKMSSAVLKKCQASNFCGVLVGSKAQTGAETLNYLRLVVFFLTKGLLLFHWGQGSSTYALGSFCRSIQYRTICGGQVLIHYCVEISRRATAFYLHARKHISIITPGCTH